MRTIGILFKVPVQVLGEFLFLTSVAGFVAAVIEQNPGAALAAAYSALSLSGSIGLKVLLKLIEHDEEE